ncbi:MAG: response regulator transcription factor [Desulfobacterales bacterium]|nr:response regulator transcription factor [Desulfobacterales bacterium]
MTSLNDRLIYIIGPRRFQNELMAFFLEGSTHAKCIERSDPSALSAAEEGNFRAPRLILWDCLGKDTEACLGGLESFGKTISRDHSVLFNLCRGSGIEQEALALGVRGFFYEEDPIGQLPKGIGAIFDGELWVSREIATQFILDKKETPFRMTRKDQSILSRRETQVLSLVAAGATNDDIAKKLYISTNTVKTHIYNIFKKINVPNRLQAALWAVKNL